MSPSATVGVSPSEAKPASPVAHSSPPAARVGSNPQSQAVPRLRHEVRRKPQPGRRSVPAVTSRATTAATSGISAWPNSSTCTSGGAWSTCATSASAAAATEVVTVSRAAVVPRKTPTSRHGDGRTAGAAGGADRDGMAVMAGGSWLGSVLRRRHRRSRPWSAAGRLLAPA